MPGGKFRPLGPRKIFLVLIISFPPIHFPDEPQLKLEKDLIGLDLQDDRRAEEEEKEEYLTTDSHGFSRIKETTEVTESTE